MQQITIREKFAPFSHTPGTHCVIPCSQWTLEAFPDRLKIGSLEVSLDTSSTQFLVQLDLERDCVWISGLTLSGRYELQLAARGGGLYLTVRRIPKAGLVIQGRKVVRQEKLLLASGPTQEPKQCERLSFGCWKAQDWDLVRKRNDPQEIIPPLFLLGQKMIAVGEPKSLEEILTHAVSGIFAHETGLWSFAYQTIRTYLLSERETGILILPRMQEHPVGRAHLRASFGWVYLQWSQGMIRKMIVEPLVTSKATFRFPQEVKSYRFCGHRMDAGGAVSLMEGVPALFDCFQQ